MLVGIDESTSGSVSSSLRHGIWMKTFMNVLFEMPAVRPDRVTDRASYPPRDP